MMDLPDPCLGLDWLGSVFFFFLLTQLLSSTRPIIKLLRDKSQVYNNTGWNIIGNQGNLPGHL